MIIPSLMATNQEDLDRIIDKAKGLGTFQLDIGDGNFVPTRILDFDFRVPKGPHYEAHLMVEDMEKYIDKIYDIAHTILPHIEAVKDPEDMIKRYRSNGKRFGFAMKPGTDTNSIAPYLDYIDQVLVLTVEPGFYGAPFVPEALEHVRKFRRMDPGIDIEVDGGMNPETFSLAFKAGANRFIFGSYLQNSENLLMTYNEIQKQYQELRNSR
jgi:ribulose-phosphate 3-epimerase